jgi:hypothetical protein
MVWGLAALCQSLAAGPCPQQRTHLHNFFNMLACCLAGTLQNGRRLVSSPASSDTAHAHMPLTQQSYAPLVGEPTTDITEQDGKRIIKRTGMYTGTELHLIR